MKPYPTWGWSLLALTILAVTPVKAQPQPTSPPPAVTYTLLDGSYFVDDCLVCGRPTIMQPLRGTFDLVLVQNTPPYYRYAVRNVDFTASPGWAGEAQLTGSGTYVRFEEFALIQDMDLALQIKNAYTNHLAFFTNDTVVAEKPFPLVQISLTQTNGTLFQTFSLDLLAAPLREFWFSTTKALTSTNRSSPTNVISPGDLISNRGRVVKRNHDLVAWLGVMPIVPDLGLDAVQVTRRGEILFSIPTEVWSETLGRIRSGDLLSNRGAIVKRNSELLARFLQPSHLDAGLDAVQVMPDGEILFSIQSDGVVNSALKLGRGDILSDRGYVFRTNRELLANFHPAVTNRDFGLDALHILPSGEIWFSVEETFADNWLGTVQPGDLLSSLGHRVFGNRQLLAAFAPADPTQDYGLDALFVITDTRRPAAPAPKIVKLRRSAGSIGVDWDGEGDVFQVEHAPGLFGPWSPCSPIVPELSFDDECELTTGNTGFYRVRQW